MLTVLLFQDFVYSAIIAFFFIISSIILTAENSRTPLELSTVVRTLISLLCLLLFLILLLNVIFFIPLLSQVFGFVASMFFIADIILFLRTYGFPFTDTKEELSNGMAATQTPPPEKEQLNIPTNATE